MTLQYSMFPHPVQPALAVTVFRYSRMYPRKMLTHNSPGCRL